MSGFIGESKGGVSSKNQYRLHCPIFDFNICLKCVTYILLRENSFLNLEKDYENPFVVMNMALQTYKKLESSPKEIVDALEK